MGMLCTTLPDEMISALDETTYNIYGYKRGAKRKILMEAVSDLLNKYRR